MNRGSPDGEVELAVAEMEAERAFNAFNTPRPGERWCPADFEYDPLKRKGLE